MYSRRRIRLLPDLDRSGGFIGIGGLACVLFLWLASAGVLGGWAITLGVATWLMLFVLACRWFVRRPARAALLPVIGVGLWLIAVVWLS